MADTTNEVKETDQGENKVGLFGLVALTVTTVGGAGLFNLPGDLAKLAAPGPALTALGIASLAFATFVFCLKYLQDHYPELDAGIFSFPEKGFGKFVGFLSCIGYCLSVVIGNVSLGVLSVSSLGYFFPIFRGGTTLPSLILCSALLWSFFFISSSGGKTASLMNAIIWIAKMVPIVVFIVVMIFAFHPQILSENLWTNAFQGPEDAQTVSDQISLALSSTIWVFVGVEGSLIYSARAKSKRQASQSIVISYIVIAVMYLLLILLSFGALSQQEVAEKSVPALSGILGSVVGDWGSILMNFGIFLSAAGCWFGCCLLAGEIMDVAAKRKIFPRTFGKENKKGQPVNAYLISTIIQQGFLITMLFNQQIYHVMALFASSTMLVPYFTVSLSMIKQSHEIEKKFNWKVLVGVLSTISMAYLLYSTGWKYVIITALLFAPCIGIYFWARKQNKEKFLRPFEWVIAIGIVALAITSIVLISNGTIDLLRM